MSYQRLLLVLAESDKDPTDTLLEWVFAAGLLAELLPDPGLALTRLLGRSEQGGEGVPPETLKAIAAIADMISTTRRN